MRLSASAYCAFAGALALCAHITLAYASSPVMTHAPASVSTNASKSTKAHSPKALHEQKVKENNPAHTQSSQNAVSHSAQEWLFPEYNTHKQNIYKDGMTSSDISVRAQMRSGTLETNKDTATVIQRALRAANQKKRQKKKNTRQNIVNITGDAVDESRDWHGGEQIHIGESLYRDRVHRVRGAAVYQEDNLTISGGPEIIYDSKDHSNYGQGDSINPGVGMQLQFNF